MSIEGAIMAEPKTNKIAEISEEDLTAARRLITIAVEAKFSGNPSQKYAPGTLKNVEGGYIDKITEEVNKLMEDQKYVAEVLAEWRETTRPDKSWN
jgi:hypothetical protein